MKQKINRILLHLLPHLVVKFGKYIKACLVKLSDLTARWGGKCDKNANFFGFTPLLPVKKPIAYSIYIFIALWLKLKKLEFTLSKFPSLNSDLCESHYFVERVPKIVVTFFKQIKANKQTRTI